MTLGAAIGFVTVMQFAAAVVIKLVAMPSFVNFVPVIIIRAAVDGTMPEKN